LVTMVRFPGELGSSGEQDSPTLVTLTHPKDGVIQEPEAPKAAEGRPFTDRYARGALFFYKLTDDLPEYPRILDARG